MLNSMQIMELKNKKFYSSTYKIMYNIHYYADIKTDFSFSFITKFSALVTFSKFIFCLFGIFNIKKFARFRNENIERALNYEISSKSVICQLESNRWLDVEKHDFKKKMQAIITSTDALYAESKLIKEIHKVLKDDSSFNPERWKDIFKMLLDDYDIIIESWNYCQYKEMLTVKNVRNKYNELKDAKVNSEQIIHNMANGALTPDINELIEFINT